MLTFQKNIQNSYNSINLSIIKKFKNVNLLICDADGVISDGYLYLSNKNIELLRFNVQDGYGIQSLLSNKVEVAVISGRCSSAIKNRCLSLGIKYIYQKQLNKIFAFKDLLKKLKLKPTQVAYVGDDIIDLPVIKKVGLSIAVANAHPKVLSQVFYITKKNGGHGAIREICDLILFSKKFFKKDKI